jgi:hypothetical protein
MRMPPFGTTRKYSRTPGMTAIGGEPDTVRNREFGRV